MVKYEIVDLPQIAIIGLMTLTGILLFVLPPTMTFIDLKYCGAIVSTPATFSAIQEGHLIRTES